MDAEQILAQLGDGTGIGHAATDHDRHEMADGPLQGVRQGQEGEESVGRVDIDQPQSGGDVPQDVVMTQHHPLGTPGGARGVDDGG